jgi:hypothetical protein
MDPQAISKRVQGHTLRFTWTDGPTGGSSHDHVFGEDGLVEWRSAVAKGASSTTAAGERVAYAAMDVSDDACLVSYLSKSGYTLSVVLNFDAGTLSGVASNDKTWMPVFGVFEVLTSPTPP